MSEDREGAGVQDPEVEGEDGWDCSDQEEQGPRWPSKKQLCRVQESRFKAVWFLEPLGLGARQKLDPPTFGLCDQGVTTISYPLHRHRCFG